MYTSNGMKVVLLKDVKNVGRKGEIREVNDGFARNSLIPKGLVKIATSGTVLTIQKMNAEKNAANEARIARLKTLAKSLSELKLKFSLRAGEKGELFGSVTAKDIEKELARFEAGEGRVVLEHPIKTLGARRVSVDFGDGIVASVTVEVKEEK